MAATAALYEGFGLALTYTIVSIVIPLGGYLSGSLKKYLVKLKTGATMDCR